MFFLLLIFVPLTFLLFWLFYQIQNRADFLDNIESNTLRPSFFETSLKPEDVFKEAKGARASRMWTQAIEAGPSQKMIDKLAEMYPVFIVKKYV